MDFDFDVQTVPADYFKAEAGGKYQRSGATGDQRRGNLLGKRPRDEDTR